MSEVYMYVYIAVHASWCICGRVSPELDLVVLKDLEPWFRVGGLEPGIWSVDILQKTSHLLSGAASPARAASYKEGF